MMTSFFPHYYVRWSGQTKSAITRSQYGSRICEQTPEGEVLTVSESPGTEHGTLGKKQPELLILGFHSYKMEVTMLTSPSTNRIWHRSSTRGPRKCQFLCSKVWSPDRTEGICPTVLQTLAILWGLERSVAMHTIPGIHWGGHQGQGLRSQANFSLNPRSTSC